MEMAGRTQTVFLNDNITITCKIPGSPALDISTVGVVWFVRKKGSEEKVPVFEYYGDHEKAYRTGANISPEKLMRGEASLHLPAIQLSDAGEYFCKVVVTPEMDEKSVQLEVVGECLRAMPGIPWGCRCRVGWMLEAGLGTHRGLESWALVGGEMTLGKV